MLNTFTLRVTWYKDYGVTWALATAELSHWVNEQASSGKNGQYGLIQIFTVN